MNGEKEEEEEEEEEEENNKKFVRPSAGQQRHHAPPDGREQHRVDGHSITLKGGREIHFLRAYMCTRFTERNYRKQFQNGAQKMELEKRPNQFNTFHCCQKEFRGIVTTQL